MSAEAARRAQDVRHEEGVETRPGDPQPQAQEGNLSTDAPAIEEARVKTEESSASLKHPEPPPHDDPLKQAPQLKQKTKDTRITKEVGGYQDPALLKIEGELGLDKRTSVEMERGKEEEAGISPELAAKAVGKPEDPALPEQRLKQKQEPVKAEEPSVVRKGPDPSPEPSLKKKQSLEQMHLEHTPQPKETSPVGESKAPELGKTTSKTEDPPPASEKAESTKSVQDESEALAEALESLAKGLDHEDVDLEQGLLLEAAKLTLEAHSDHEAPSALQYIGNTRDLPQVVIHAEHDLRTAVRDQQKIQQQLLEARARLESARGSDETDVAALRADAKRLETACEAVEARRRLQLRRYLTEVGAELRQQSLYPNHRANPRWRNTVISMGVSLVQNLLCFTLPIYAASALAPGENDPDDVRKQKTLMQMGVIALLSLTYTGVSELSQFVQRKTGGVATQLHLSLPNSANVGTYKTMAGDLVMAMYGLMIYSLVGTLAGLGNPENNPFTNDPVGAGHRGLLSAAVMSISVPLTNHLGSSNTLKRSGVSDAKYLDESQHNRTRRNGLYQTHLGPYDHRTTTPNKLKEVAAAQGANVAQSAAMLGPAFGAAMQFAGAPASQIATTLFGGFSAFFVLGTLCKLAYTYTDNDPARQAKKFGNAASDVAVDMLQRSALKSFEGLLNNVGLAMEGGLMPEGDAAAAPTLHESDGEETQSAGLQALVSQTQQFLDAVSILSGADFRSALAERPLDPDDSMFLRPEEQPAATALEAMVGRFETLAGELEAARDKDRYTVTAGTMGKIAHTLREAAQSLQDATRGDSGVFQPAVKDAIIRIRDVQALLLQSMYQVGESPESPDGSTVPDVGGTLNKVANDMLPVFAALRKVDRMDVAEKFGNNLTDFATGRKKAAQVSSALTGKQRVMARDVAEHFGDEVTASNLKAALNLSASMPMSKPPSFEHSKLLILGNLLSRQASAAAAGAGATVVPAGQPEPARFFASLRDPTQTPSTVMLLTAFKNGRFTAQDLQGEISKLQDASDRVGDAVDVEATGDLLPITAAQARAALDRLTEVLGEDFLNALEEEFPTAAPSPQKGMANFGQEMLADMWQDTGEFPEMYRRLMATALSLPIMDAVPLETRKQNDGHFHPTSYSGKITSLSQLIDYMNMAGIKRTNLAGIPSQVWHLTAAGKYYATSPNGLSYRDHDYPLAMAWQELPKELQDRLDLSITGIDVTNGPKIRDELDLRLKNHPGAFKSVGEVTWKKEIVTKDQEHQPEINSSDAQDLLGAAAERGLPVILHCDRGEPGDKKKWLDQITHALEEWAERTDDWQANDPLAKAGRTDVPPIKGKVIWAHGAGISRFTSESNDHTRDLDTLLEKKELKDKLYLDLSWDYIGQDILDNLGDQFKREGDDNPTMKNSLDTLRDGLQNLSRTYKVFAEEGARADKADDMGDPNQAAIHRAAAESTAQQYFLAVEDFKARVKEECRDNPEVLNHFKSMMKNHGDNGNNWLYVCSKHKDRLLFGTDALAVGIKAHGDSAYAMNTRVLYPLFDILEEVEADEMKQPQAMRDEALIGISDNIRWKNYESVLHDPEMEARRTAWEEMLQTEKPTESQSSHARPNPFTTDTGPVTAELEAMATSKGRPATVEDSDDDHDDGEDGLEMRPLLQTPQLRRRGTAMGGVGQESSYTSSFAKPSSMSSGAKGGSVVVPQQALAPRPEKPGERLDRAHLLADKSGIDIMRNAEAVDLVASRPLGGTDSGQSATAKPMKGVITPAPKPTSEPLALAANQGELEAVAQYMPQAKAWLKEQGAVIVPNSGKGLNCLIISLLQHATAAYTEDLQGQLQIEKTAAALRKELNLGDGMLYGDDPKFAQLVERINALYPDAGLNVTIARPGPDNTFTTFNHNPNANGKNPVLILQGADHYEAVTMAARRAGA